MVRRKRKGLVKESLTGGDATGAPRASNVRHVVRDVPLNARMPFVVETDTKKPSHGENDSAPLDLATWFATLSDATTRFEQLRVLQAFRAGAKRLTGAEPGVAAFAEGTWRLFARLHGDPTLQPLQKNFGLVLGDFVAAHRTFKGPAAWPLESVAREELRTVLETLFESAATEGNKDVDEVARRISHLQSLLELPLFLQLLIHDSSDGSATSTLRRTLQFLADQLAVLVQPIAAYQAVHGDDAQEAEEEDEEKEGSSSATNAVLLASERASVALKCIIVLSSCKEALYAQLVGSHATETGAFADAAVDVMRLLNCCTLILKTRVVHKDLLTQTGLAYCLVLRLLLHGSLQTSEQVHTETIRLMLDAVYQKSITSALTGDVRTHLDEDMQGFGEFARLAVLRGFVNSLSDDEHALSVADLVVEDSSDSSRSILDVVFETVHASCSDESLNTRLYAFQVLEAFLRRAVSGLSKQTNELTTPSITQATVANLTGAVLLNWENPSKRVNQFMHLLFTHIVNFQVLAHAFEDWKTTVVVKLIQLPHHSRARYGGLSILVPRYGAATLLTAHPRLLQSILYAVGIKDVSAAAAALFTQILDALNEKGSKRSDEGELQAWRAYWMGDVVDVLLSDDRKLRASVAMYALPLLLQKDPACISVLIETLRTQGRRDSTTKDVALWAIIEVLKFARRKIAPEKLLGLSVNEIQQGLENARAEARGAAFEALCASLKSTNLPTSDEVKLIKKFLVISAKEITAATRVNSLNGLKTVFFRVKEFLRINDKESTNPHVTDAEKAAVAQEVARAKAFQSWVELFVVTSVYPGALVQRSIVGLEVLLLHLQVVGVPTTNDESLLLTPHMVTCLLNMLIGSWDVVRSLANTILDLYPAVLPGFCTFEEMERLWQWALTLCVSPRQRESDAGAHFMLLLYTRSDSLVAHGVADLPTTLPTGEGIRDARVRLVLKLTDIIAARLEAANLAHGESPLVHGLLLAVRYILDHTTFTAVTNHIEWKAALARVLDSVHASMKFSLAIVGDATSGVGDATLSETFDGGVVGEVSAAGGKTSSIPLRVDCRGHLILEESDAEAANVAEDSDDADAQQRAVVGSWLAARECGAIVDMVLRRVPLPTTDEATNLFAPERARDGGEMLLNSLFQLKHKGAVATAYEAFEGVCKSLLGHGEKNPQLGSLPSLWADQLLARLEKSEQQFILRRSSGFAYSFVAILRAEPRHTAALILPRVMTTLLRLAAQDTDAIAATTTHTHLVWRARVHALNILKLIAQDAVLADDVAVYVAAMLEHAVFGFECRSWVVRNSSMMLFAAATQRALGDKRIADGASKNKIPSAEVFSRFPQLAGFLHDALARFTHAAMTEGVVPPGLFPVLMFLSRLRPTDELEDAELRARGSKPLVDFVPLVLVCASQSVLPIRQMAAYVLGAIVRVDMALPVLQQLSASLPQGVRATVKAGETRDKPKSSNHVHGVLLQAQGLITKCLAEQSANADAVSAVLAYVTTAFLPTHVWLASDRVKCASIRAVVWEMIEAVFQYEAEQPGRLVLGELTQPVTKLLLAKIDSFLAIAPGLRDANRSPGEYNCNRAIVGTFFGLLQLHWKPTAKDTAFNQMWMDRVASLVQSPVLEVRKRAFKKLAKFMGSSTFDFEKEISIVMSLQTILLQQLVVETHPTVKTRLLQLLIAIQESPAATNTRAVDTLLGLLATSANVNVVGPSLQLLAAVVRDGASSDAVLRALQHNVVERSGDAQPLGLRYAAAVAIDRSELLVAHTTHRDRPLDIALDAWRAAITLLQDDDSHVRGVIRAAVHRALCSSDRAFALDASVSETALLPVAIRYTVQTFSSSSKGVEAISAMLLATIDAPSMLRAYATGSKNAQDWGDLSTRIFEAEGNNFYAEADLVAQVLATCVFAAPSMASLKKEVLDNLVQSLTLLNASHSQTQWLGGMAYYASVFPTLSSLLCVGVAAVASLDEIERRTHREVLTRVHEQAAIALPFLQQSHPLVAKAVAALSDNISVIAADVNVVRDLVFLSPEWTAIQ